MLSAMRPLHMRSSETASLPTITGSQRPGCTATSERMRLSREPTALASSQAERS